MNLPNLVSFTYKTAIKKHAFVKPQSSITVTCTYKKFLTNFSNFQILNKKK